MITWVEDDDMRWRIRDHMRWRMRDDMRENEEIPSGTGISSGVACACKKIGNMHNGPNAG